MVSYNNPVTRVTAIVALYLYTGRVLEFILPLEPGGWEPVQEQYSTAEFLKRQAMGADNKSADDKIVFCYKGCRVGMITRSVLASWWKLVKTLLI